MEMNAIPEGFKTTELGPLPEEWEVVRLGEVAKYINGYAFKPIQWKKRGLPIIRIQNLTRSTDEINYYDEELEERYKIRNGDLLISWSASLGVFKWSGSDAWLNQHIFKVDNYSPNIWKDYLHYVVMTKIESMKPKTHGSTMHHITKKEFLAVKIPLPPLPEQRAIAKVLSTVQDAKEKTDAVITATKELKKSLMKHLFTYGPVSVEEAENVPLNETEIGLVPEEWDVVMLGDVAEQRKETINPEDGDWKYVGLEHISPCESHLKRWGFSNEVQSSKWKFYPCDILYGKLRPYLDKGALVDFEGICSTDIIVIKPKEELNEKLLSYLVHIDSFREYATRTMTGVNHPRTSWRALSQFSVPFPSSTIQQKIASILSAVDEKIEKEETKKKSLEELFKTLLNNLMTGKLRVNHLEV